MSNQLEPIQYNWEMVDGPDGGGYYPDDEPGHGVSWRRYVAALRRFKWLILAAVLVGGVIGGFGTRLVEPRYVARATIWITNPDTRGQVAGQGPIRSEELLRSYAWLDLLRSNIVLDPVVNELRLFIRHESADSGLFRDFTLSDEFAPGRYSVVVGPDRGYQLVHEEHGTVERGQLGDSIGNSVGFLWSPPERMLTVGREVEFEVTTPREAANLLAERLNARLPQRDGNFMAVELEGTNPVGLARTVNAVNTHFVEVASELKRAKLDELTEILNEQLRQAEQNLMQAEIALQQFRVETITLPSDPATPVVPGLEMTRDPAVTRYFDMRVERESLRQERQLVQEALAPPLNPEVLVQRLETVQSLQSSSELQDALTRLVEQRSTYRALLRQYTEEHPTVASVADEMNRLEQDVIPGLTRNLLGEMQTREATIDRMLGSAAGELRQIPPRAINEARLRRDVQIKEDLFTVLEGRYEEARLAAVSSIPDVRILDPAIPPRQPVNHDVALRILLMSVVGCLGLAVAGVLVWDRVDPRLRYPEQVSTDMGLPIIGVVAHALEDRGWFRKGNLNAVREAFRSLRLNLMHAYGSAGPLAVTISSPGSGDGKSFVSQNLARGFADLGRKTLLVDGDVRRGRLHRAFAQDRVPGLIDGLRGRATLDQIVRPTGIPNLDLVPTGTVFSRAPEILASPELRTFFGDLRTRYDVIIVDTPPLGAGVDPFLLGTLTGSMLLVLRTGETDRLMANAQLESLRRLPIRILGGVLNGVETVGIYKYYSYLPEYELPDHDEDEELQQLVPATSTGD